MVRMRPVPRRPAGRRARRSPSRTVMLIPIGLVSFCAFSVWFPGRNQNLGELLRVPVEGHDSVKSTGAPSTKKAETTPLRLKKPAGKDEETQRKTNEQPNTNAPPEKNEEPAITESEAKLAAITDAPAGSPTFSPITGSPTTGARAGSPTGSPITSSPTGSPITGAQTENAKEQQQDEEATPNDGEEDKILNSNSTSPLNTTEIQAADPSSIAATPQTNSSENAQVQPRSEAEDKNVNSNTTSQLNFTENNAAYRPSTTETQQTNSSENAQQQQSSNNIAASEVDAVSHRVAGLSCEAFGGPSNAEDVVYWKDIPADANFVSPLKRVDSKEEQYLTFEPDEGGFNNIRMAMETAVALAVSMGRTLVLPPKMKFYLLWDHKGGAVEHNTFGFEDFFHIDSVVREHSVGLKTISFEEFLEREAMTGNLRDTNGTVSFPPGNKTDWTGEFFNFESTKQGKGKPLWEWMRSVTRQLNWTFDDCVVGIPSDTGGNATERFNSYMAEIQKQDEIKYVNSTLNRANWFKRMVSFKGKPTPVNASATERLAEMSANRQSICVYDETMQNTKIVHALGESSSGFRLLVHFYAYLFFEDWKHDLWLKRFIRDHFRYIDEIQCAAARIIEQVRKRAIGNGNQEGEYDAFHIRRGDFQYSQMLLTAEEIYEGTAKAVIHDNRTVFIATDEKNKTFFDPLREHYNLLFLDDFMDVIPDVNKNYFGMLDQLVASRSQVFIGVMYSTFTGYINRLRGYHAQKHRLDGHEQGLIQSYYYEPPDQEDFRNSLRTYHSVKQPFWAEEFPVCWRDIDHDVVYDEVAEQSRRL